MPTLTVKNIPDDLYLRLKRSATANRRSLNSEIIVCIERTLVSQPIDPQAVLASARLLRERTADYPISDDEFATAKAMGRE